MSVIVRDRTSDDEAWVGSSLRQTWGSPVVARLGELIDATALPGVVAEVDGERVGLATVAFRGEKCELVSLSTTIEGRGVGRALVQRCAMDARAAGCRTLWLVTTNDNLRAYGFYQRLGMDLRALHRDAVTADRRLKPQIPLHGAFGIPIRHLLEFELFLEEAAIALPDEERIS